MANLNQSILAEMQQKAKQGKLLKPLKNGGFFRLNNESKFVIVVNVKLVGKYGQPYTVTVPTSALSEPYVALQTEGKKDGQLTGKVYYTSATELVEIKKANVVIIMQL